MHRTHFLFGALGVSVSVFATFVGCGSDAENEDEASGAGASGGELVGQPPPRPAEQVPGDGDGAVLAIRKLYLGDTDRTGAKSASAWKNFGFNIDGKVSVETSTDLCKPRAGGKKSDVYPDGNNGIDNSFGANILPIITGVATDAANDLNANIVDGTFTIMLSLEKLGPAATYNPIVTRLYGGANLGGPAKFDGTDVWPVIRELLTDPNDITSSKVVFNESYVTNNTWVSGSKAPLNLSLSIAGFTLNLGIGSALIAMDLDEAHRNATNGVIAGVIDTEAFITELKKVAGAFSEDLCTGTTIESIANQLRQASDIMKDGTAGSPTVECDGISIGLGFDSALVQLGPVAPPAEPQPDPCATTSGGGGEGTGGTASTGGGGGAGGGT
jgi:hypothetical protein